MAGAAVLWETLDGSGVSGPLLVPSLLVCGG